MPASEILTELREIKEKLTKVESMLRFIIEKNVGEEEPLPDEVEALESTDELVDLDEVKKQLHGEK